MAKDLKAALGNGSKPDLTHVRGSPMRYMARGCEYGNAKYERANYLRSAGDTVRDDFERLRGYTRATINHLVAMLDAMEHHQANDPNLEDDEGLKRAAYAADTDATPGAKVGASGLPHIAHAAASLMMAIEQAVDSGLLPDDPGQPWAVDAPSPIIGNPDCTDRNGGNKDIGVEGDCWTLLALNGTEQCPVDFWDRGDFCGSCREYYA